MIRRPLSAAISLVLTLLACQSAMGAYVLMLTDNNGSLTAVETTLKSRLEMVGHTVNTLWDADTQANYTAAIANNDVVYIPSDISAADVANKLRTCTIGVVNEVPGLMDELGLCSTNGTTTTVSSFNIATNSHYVTSGFTVGTFTIGSSTYVVSQAAGTTASGGVVLATVGAVNSMIAVDTGGTLANTISSNSTAAGRRIQMPVQCGVVDIATLSANMQLLLQRIVLWAALAEGKLEAHWKLNETSGTSAADASGLGRTGTVTGTTNWTSGVLNNGFAFDGATKFQATGLMGNPRNVSIAGWANLTTADSAGAEIISLGDHFALRLDDSGVTKAMFYNGSTYVTASVSIAYAKTGWHNFAAVLDDGHDKLKLYVDGVLAATTTTTASVSWSGLGTNTVVGRHGNAATTSDFTGTLDDVRVYSYAISAIEVAQMYGLMGQWKLNQTSGTTATDSTTFNRSATLTGTAAWSTDCGGMADFDFNGSTHYFTISNAADFQPTTTLSIAAWVKGDAWGSGSSTNTILRKGDTSPNNYTLQISDGRVELLLNGSDGSGIRGNTVLTAGAWYHVAATWDGATARIYVNGVLDNSPGTAKASPITTDTRPLYIGGRSGGRFFDGMIRDVRLYNRVLLSSELVNMSGLVGYWKFAEGSGTSAADSSGLGNTATLSGGAGWTSDCAGNNNALLTNGAGGIAQSTVPFTPPDVGTVAFWMRSTGAPAGVARIIGVGADWEIRQQPDGTVVTDLCGDGATTICTVTPLTEVGRWYHVALTFDSSNDTYAIYVDGQLERSGTSPNNLVQQPTALISFGTRTGTSEYWSGALRDVRIYSRKLCPTEIAALYGLIGYWKFDETSGTTASDSSGLGNDGTYMNGPTLGASAPRNLAAYFPSDNKYMIAPASATLNTIGASNGDFSTAFWVKPAAATGGWRPLLHKGGADFDRSPGVWLNPGSNRVHFRLSTTNNNNEGTDSVANLTTNGWSHIACVKSGNKWRCYINGTLDTEYTLSANSVGNNGPLYLGDDPWYGGSNCYMDDVRAYNRALCPSEISAIYGGAVFQGVRVTKWIEIQ